MRRPRPQSIIDRDERVLALLASAGPLSKRDIADRLDLDPNDVFLSLYRLNGRGRVTRGPGKKWRA
jgi:DNA-binding MarR family transcriptional regulator